MLIRCLKRRYCFGMERIKKKPNRKSQWSPHVHNDNNWTKKKNELSVVGFDISTYLNLTIYTS